MGGKGLTKYNKGYVLLIEILRDYEVPNWFFTILWQRRYFNKVQVGVGMGYRPTRKGGYS